MAMPTTSEPSHLDPLVPYSNFRFKLLWLQHAKPTHVAGFSRVSALSRSTQTTTHQEGGHPSVLHVAPGQTEYSPITLSRGMSYDTAFEQWANHVFYHPHSRPEPAQDAAEFRKDLFLEMYNEAGQKVLAYTIDAAWVSEFNAIPDFDANGEPVTLIETATIQNAGWRRDMSVAPTEEPKLIPPAGDVV